MTSPIRCGAVNESSHLKCDRAVGHPGDHRAFCPADGCPVRWPQEVPDDR